MTDRENAAAFTYPSYLEIVITRIFDAQRNLVFKVVTDPNLIPQLWGPKRFTTTVDKMDMRPDGVWRVVQHDPDGNEYAFNGVYREIVPPERLVYTFEFEGMPGHVILETVTFEEQDGKTKQVVTDLFQTIEDRDGMYKSEWKKERSKQWTALRSYWKGKIIMNVFWKMCTRTIEPS